MIIMSSPQLRDSVLNVRMNISDTRGGTCDFGLPILSVSRPCHIRS